ncbi:MAG: septal ring lytic transglycosylase RlpA family protein [Pseudomonadota bacterium]
MAQQFGRAALVGVILGAASTAGCAQRASDPVTPTAHLTNPGAPLNNAADPGAGALPSWRVAHHTNRIGGSRLPQVKGHRKVGRPYQVAGRWYHPRVDTSYNRVGTASWYGPGFHGKKTANGEIYDQNTLTAAHPTLPLPSIVAVTNLDNNRTILVRVNDRGPFAHNREIDMSAYGAALLDFKNDGVAKVRVRFVRPAPLRPDDSYERNFLRRQPWARQVLNGQTRTSSLY